MKHFILAVFTMFVFNTYADMMYMPNQDGGLIELYDFTAARCPDGTRVAKTWTQTMPDMYGCWYYVKETNTVNVRWFTPAGKLYHKTYSASDFAFIESTDL